MPPKATKPKLAGASSVPKAKSVPSSNRAHGSTPAAAKSKKPKEQAMETIVSRDESLHEELQAMEARATEAEARAEAAEAKVRTLEKAFAEQANMEEKLRAEISRLEQLLGRATAGPPTSAIAILPAPARRMGSLVSPALDALSTSAPAAAPAPAADVRPASDGAGDGAGGLRAGLDTGGDAGSSSSHDGAGGCAASAAVSRRDRARRRWRRPGCRRGIGGEGAAR